MPRSTSDEAKRILVIEDNGAVRAFFEEVLTDAGYQVFPFDHALDPADVEQLRPDIVLLDVVIGGRKVGPDYLRSLRSYPPTAGIPVIVCSGDHETLRELSEGRAPLATRVMLKPIYLMDLLDTVALVVRQGGTVGSSEGARDRNSMRPRQRIFDVPDRDRRATGEQRRGAKARRSVMRAWLLHNAATIRGGERPDS